jgi:hypothetical protein
MLLLEMDIFASKKEIELKKASFRAKFKTVLLANITFNFNKGTIRLISNDIVLTQKNQGKRLQFINPLAFNRTT